MYCRKCGKEIDDVATVCPSCGEEVVLVDNFDSSELVKKAQAGDEEAFTELYNYYYPSMLKIAYKHTMASGKTNQQDAEDVLQDAMVKAYKSINSLDDPSKFKTWLTTIVTNRAKDIMTSSFKKNNVSLSSLATEDKDGKELEYDPEDEVGTYQPDIILDNQTRQDILKDVMSHLSEEQRMITVMYFYDEMSLKEISEELGIPMSTVTGRFALAKKNIKKEISSIQKKQDLKLYNISAIPFFMWLLGKARTETEKQVANTATKTVASLATKQVAEKVATTTTSNVASGVTATTATTTATTTAAVGTGVSVATKVAIGAAIAVTAVGGGYVGYKHFIDTDNKSKSAEVADEETTEATTSDEKYYEIVPSNENEVTYADIKAEIPDGWTAVKTVMKTDFDEETPVLYFYKGDVSDDNPYMRFYMLNNYNSNNIQDNDDYDYGFCTWSSEVVSESNETFGEETMPYGMLYSYIIDNPKYEMKTPFYRFSPFMQDGATPIVVEFYNKDISVVNNTVLDTIIDSEILSIGYLRSNGDLVDGIGADFDVYESSNLDSTLIGNVAIYNKEWCDIYEKKQDLGFTWYRIGAHAWINDKDLDPNTVAFTFYNE